MSGSERTKGSPTTTARKPKLKDQRHAVRHLASALLLCLVAWLGLPVLLRAQLTTAELASGSKEMVGQMAPAWTHRGWANSQPLEIGQLVGKVILLRFFSDQPAGASAVRELYRKYQDQGLTAVGIYVPSPMPTETDAEHVRRLAISLGFDFPVGVDSGWQTVNRYWLNRADAEAAAATFLIDRRGVIRHIQPDGRYEKDSRDRKARQEYENLEKQIQALLKEPPPE